MTRGELHTEKTACRLSLLKWKRLVEAHLVEPVVDSVMKISVRTRYGVSRSFSYTIQPQPQRAQKVSLSIGINWR